MTTPFELREHPARRRNAITNLLEPLLPDQHSIWLHGRMIGYCGAVPNRPICLIEYFPARELDMILEFVASQELSPTRIVCPPPIHNVCEPSRLWTPEGYDDDDE